MNELGGEVPRRLALPEGAAAAVWSLDTTREVVGGIPVGEAAAVLDPAELRRAKRLSWPADRLRYIAAHIGLRALLGGLLSSDPARIALVRADCPACGGPHGRPEVAGGGVHFSLSRRDDLAYFALAPVPVGIDIEGIPGPDVVSDLLDFLHPAEAAELTALPEGERRAALARVWSRKEACLKAAGTGIALGLVEPYVGSAPTPARVPDWHLSDLPAPDGYAAALAWEP